MLPAAAPPLVLLLLLVLAASPGVRTFEAREDRQDVFARRACPAFLSFGAAAFLSGATVELPCLCKPPQIQSVVWFFRKHSGGAEDTRALTDLHGNRVLDSSRVPHGGDLRSRFSIRLFSLLIFRAGPDDAGVYICGSASGDFFYGYDLDLQEARVVRFSPHSSPRTLIGGRARRVSGPREPYRVFTGFQPWSVCDRCGIPGEQVRAGLCYVRSRFLHVRYRRANQTAPCGSGALPAAFGHLRKTGATLEVRGCNVSCAAGDAPSSTLLALLAFLGYSSASAPQEVQVYYLTHPAEGVLALGCPGARPNMAVAWDREARPIYRFGDVDAAPRRRRLLIDAGNNLVFQPAKTEDSGTYHCWLQGRRAAEIRLLVHPRLGRRPSVFAHPDFPAAVRTLLKWYGVMTAAFCLLLGGRVLLGRVLTGRQRDATQTHLD